METAESKLRKFHLSKRAKPVEIDALLADIKTRQEPLLVKQREHDRVVVMPYAMYRQLFERAAKEDSSQTTE